MAARLEEFRIKQQQLCDLEQLLRQKLLSLERREAELGIAERAAETQRLQSQQILEARSSELVESKRRIREELTEALKAAKVHQLIFAACEFLIQTTGGSESQRRATRSSRKETQGLGTPLRST
jgi:hypothetical protein